MGITSRRVIAGLAAIAWLLPLAARIEAQTVTGTILGTVSDTSGARVAGAAVAAVNESTREKHSATSNGMGDYLLITVQRQLMRNLSLDAVILGAGAGRIIQFGLKYAF